jgi:hypothetical protein
MPMGTALPASEAEQPENLEPGGGIADLGQLCRYRSDLVKQYEAAIETYTASITAMMGLRGEELRDAFQVTLEVRDACETRHAALVDHELQHKCSKSALAREHILGYDEKSAWG